MGLGVHDQPDPVVGSALLVEERVEVQDGVSRRFHDLDAVLKG